MNASAPMVLRPLRHSCSVDAPGATATLNRAGATVRQWSHIGRCWLIPLRDMPAVIRQAEREGRPVVIEDGSR